MVETSHMTDNELIDWALYGGCRPPQITGSVQLEKRIEEAIRLAVARDREQWQPDAQGDIRLKAQAEMSASLEAGVRGANGIYPGWVYEAREAIRHQNEQIPWLPDLLAIFGWHGGTIHQALQAVSRLVQAETRRQVINAESVRREGIKMPRSLEEATEQIGRDLGQQQEKTERRGLTQADVAHLEPGLYLLEWVNGKSSQAAVLALFDGTRCYVSTSIMAGNMVDVVGDNWSCVAAVYALTVQDAALVVPVPGPCPSKNRDFWQCILKEGHTGNHRTCGDVIWSD